MTPSRSAASSRRAALILGCAVWADGPSPTLRRRTAHAAALWHQGEVAWLVACGGLGTHPPVEAEAMRDLLLEHGVAPEAIRLEDCSRNTHENILLALPILADIGATSAVIVTDATHAPRARLIAWGLGLRATSSSPPLRGSRLWSTLKQALREVAATAVALWRLLRR
jgi:vancomycin permeability regulator SanA